MVSPAWGPEAVASFQAGGLAFSSRGEPDLVEHALARPAQVGSAVKNARAPAGTRFGGEGDCASTFEVGRLRGTPGKEVGSPVVFTLARRRTEGSGWVPAQATRAWSRLIGAHRCTAHCSATARNAKDEV